jgi:hypothetical protein
VGFAVELDRLADGNFLVDKLLVSFVRAGELK